MTENSGDRPTPQAIKTPDNPGRRNFLVKGAKLAAGFIIGLGAAKVAGEVTNKLTAPADNNGVPTPTPDTRSQYAQGESLKHQPQYPQTPTIEQKTQAQAEKDMYTKMYNNPQASEYRIPDPTPDSPPTLPKTKQLHQ